MLETRKKVIVQIKPEALAAGNSDGWTISSDPH